MRNISKRLSIFALSGMMAASAMAQTNGLRSAYFLDGYMYRHELNPAMASERNYVAVPAIGNLNVGLQGNVGVNNFLYKNGQGKLTTFMNGMVDADDFLSGLKDANKFNANVSMRVLSAGFRAFNGYNTVEINVKATVNGNLPKSLFHMLKNGASGINTVYDINDLSVSAQAYAELAFGHSQQITDKLNVGAKAKLLFGLGQGEAKINNAHLYMTEDDWQITTDGEMSTSVNGLIMPTRAEMGRSYDEGRESVISWDDVDYDFFGLSGMGLAFDLGATYQVLPSLEVSASLLDLGFIRWKNTITGRTTADAFDYDGFEKVGLKSDSEDKIEDQWDIISDELEDLVEFERDDSKTKKTRGIGATLALGASYVIPHTGDKLKVGFLSTTRINGEYSWSEGRFSANCEACKVFDCGINYAISSFGSSFGWVVNVHSKGFNFFLGSDHQFFKLTKQGLPVGKANMNVVIGMNITFGKAN